MRGKLRNAQQGEQPHIVEPNATYTAQQLRLALGLRPNTLRREIASGRLRVSRRAGRYFFLGEFVLEWLRSGEVARHERHEG